MAPIPTPAWRICVSTSRESIFEARKTDRDRPGQTRRQPALSTDQRPTPARRMPPESAHKSLTPAQIAKLKLWIEQGAPWKEHWAYRAPVQAAAARREQSAWVRNPIDRFILAKLEAKGPRPRARGGPPHPDPARRARSDRPAAHSRRARHLPEGHLAQRLRAHGRSLSRLAALRRTSRALLAGRRALWRYAWHPYR